MMNIIKTILKNSAPFFNCILKINNQLIEVAQDLDIVMPMFNLLYCSKNFRKTTGSFWNYYPDKPKPGYDNEDNERQRIFYPIKDSESFDYKTKLINTLSGNADAANDVTTEPEDIKIIVPLKNLSNFIFSLNFLMINTEIALILKWSQNCVLTEKAATQNPPQDAVPAINLLDHKDETYSKYQTKRWYIINDRNNGSYGEGEANDKPIKIDTELVKPFLCDYANAYILVICNIPLLEVILIQKFPLKIVIHLLNQKFI